MKLMLVLLALAGFAAAFAVAAPSQADGGHHGKRDSTTGTARCFFGISGYIGKQAKARAQFPSLQLVDIWGRAAERDWPRRP